MKQNHHYIGSMNSDIVKQPTAADIARTVKSGYAAMLARRRAAGKSTVNLEIRGWRKTK